MKFSPRKEAFHLSLGERGEMIAWDFLIKQGFRILEKNFKCAIGEIDVVAERGKKIVFVEVKTRTDHAFGRPEEAVHAAKQKKLIRLAEWYLKAAKKEGAPVSFAVVAVTAGAGAKPEIQLFEDAFEVS